MARRVALHEKVYDSLSNRVYNGQYTYGDKLPSMAALTQEYGVSVTTMRMALRRLQSDGLITMAQGREATVTLREPSSFSQQDYAEWLSTRRKAILDVAAMHRTLISGIIAHSAACAKQDSLDALAHICARTAAVTDLGGLFDAFYSFVSELLRASGNATIVDIYAGVNEFIRVPLMGALEDEPLARVRESTRRFMRDVIDLTRAGAYGIVYQRAKRFYEAVFEHIASFTRNVGACAPEHEVPFRWVLRSENKYLYSTIANDLIIKIACGEYREDALLPSEAQLRLLYGASTISVRRSLRMLGLAGVVRTRKGKGTFVTLMKAVADPGEIHVPSAKRHAEAVHIMALCLPHIAALTLQTADAQSSVAGLAACVRERLEHGCGSYLYAVSALMHAVISNCPNDVIQYICAQLEAEQFLGRIHVYGALRFAPELSAYLDARMRGLLDALETKDARALSQACYDQLRRIYKFTLDTYAARGARLDLPPLEDLELL